MIIGMAQAQTIRTVLREVVKRSIKATEIVRPIHDALVTVIASAKIIPAIAISRSNAVLLFFVDRARKKPSAREAISCNTSAYVIQIP
jgi:hypothetical protein